LRLVAFIALFFALCIFRGFVLSKGQTRRGPRRARGGGKEEGKRPAAGEIEHEAAFIRGFARATLAKPA
ncbi:MAG: hypothetical protein ACOYB4_09685, partial [Methyloceanibacter sp.]